MAYNSGNTFHHDVEDMVAETGGQLVTLRPRKQRVVNAGAQLSFFFLFSLGPQPVE